MLVIIIYYLVLFFLVLPFGLAAENILKIRNPNPSVTIVLGLSFLVLWYTALSFFLSLNVMVFLLTLVVAIFLYIFLYAKIKVYFINLFVTWKRLTRFYKYLLLIIVVLTCFRSAGLPFVLDNESYYVQTIKWLNEFGLVKGLANLHVFLGQNSAWHALQAGLNFSFVVGCINDINGFLLIIFCLFAFIEHQTQGEKSWIVFVLLFNVLLFQLVDAPSPDIPIILLSQMLFYFFLKHDLNNDNLKIGALIFSFMLLVKLTALPFICLFVFWVKSIKALKITVVTIILYSALWIVKNSIISGCPLYPFNWFCWDVEWALPIVLRDFISSTIFIWDQTLKVKVIYIILMSLLTLVVSRFLENKKKYNHLLFVLLLHLSAVVIFTSQFRFMLPGIICIVSMLFSIMVVKENQRAIKISLTIGVFLPLIFMFPVSLEAITSNPHHQVSSKSKLRQIIVPQENSSYSHMEFNLKTKGNMKYYSPKESFFFFGTANGKLPCVNEEYLKYFENYYGVFPQMRTEYLNDGFYSKRSPNKN